MRPRERLSPSAFAAAHRRLKEGTTPQPGPWSNDVFPYLVPVMDAVAEAVETGRNLVIMKSAQGGGSEAMINALAWVMTYYPGPALYLISKDDLAREFGRDRFGYLNETCRPLAEKHLGGRAAGELLQAKRYADGKLMISGGRSVLNLQSQPYRAVFIDEVDSLLDEIQGQGDPVKLAEVRTDAYSEFGPTVIVAFGHPSTRERGAGKLYYERSDQRRLLVACPHCAARFALSWSHVSVAPVAGEPLPVAERNPDRYVYLTPCCSRVLGDAERFSACRSVQARSTLPQEEAARRRWIGVHFSQLYSKHLRWLAQEWIQGLDDPAVARVFANRRLGDVYDVAEQQVGAERWAELAVAEGEPGAYKLGTVPSGVQFLTAGQDSRLQELHWAVWGWGYAATAAGVSVLRGWLVDAGVEPGPAASDASRRTLDASDLHVLDQALYDRYWPAVDPAQPYRGVDQGLHDSGWQPIAVYEYCRSRRDRGRALPAKGAAEDDRSRAPAVTWTASPRWRLGDQEVTDPTLKRADLNTYALKTDLFGLVEKRHQAPDGSTFPRLTLPHDVRPEVLEQLGSERLVLDRGRRRWRRRGPNHWLDCAVMAYAAALNLQALLPPRPAAPASEAPRVVVRRPSPARRIRTRY